MPDDDMIAIMKRSMTAFHESSHHLTINKDRVSVNLEIPPETVFILTSVGTSIDDQLRDRQLTVPVDKNPELDRQYADFLTKHALTGESPNIITPGIELCREMMHVIKSRRYRVIVPFAEQIQFTDDAIGNRRAINTFFDYIWSSAILNHRTRKTEDYKEYLQVVATTDDFQAANDLFPKSEYQWNLKLSKREKQVYDLIATAGVLGMEGSKIVASLEVDKGYCYRFLHGDPKRNLAGLVDKAPVMFIKEYNRDTGRYNNVWTVTRNLKDGLVSFATLVDTMTTEGQPEKQPTFAT